MGGGGDGGAAAVALPNDPDACPALAVARCRDGEPPWRATCAWGAMWDWGLADRRSRGGGDTPPSAAPKFRTGAPLPPPPPPECRMAALVPVAVLAPDITVMWGVVAPRGMVGEGVCTVGVW